MDKKTLEILKQIVLDYRNKEVGREYFYELVNAYNNDSLINGRIIVRENSPYKRMCVNTNTNEFFVNFDNIANVNNQYVKKLINSYPNNEKELYNYFFTHFIFHEIEHVKQNIYASEYSHEYEVINDLYYLLNILVNRANIFQVMRYSKKGANYSFERNANMEAGMLLYDMYEDELMKEIAKLNYFFDALNGYNVKGKRVICPVEYTLRQYGEKFVLDEVEDIPLDIAFSHGLYIDLNQLTEILSFTAKYDYIEKIDFEGYKKILRKEK